MPRIGEYPPFGKRFSRRARKLIGSSSFGLLAGFYPSLASIDTMEPCGWRCQVPECWRFMATMSCLARALGL